MNPKIAQQTMHFKYLKEKVGALGIKKIVRINTPNYYEIVFLNEDYHEVLKMLESFFGPCAYPGKKGLSSAALKAINNFGGIREGQTLFLWHKEGCFIFCMIWPWQDNQHITLKLAEVS